MGQSELHSCGCRFVKHKKIIIIILLLLRFWVNLIILKPTELCVWPENTHIGLTFFNIIYNLQPNVI